MKAFNINPDLLKSFAQQVQAETPVEEVVMEPIVRQVPKVLETRWASVIVFGHELVSGKDMDILMEVLENTEGFKTADHGVRVIFLRDDHQPIAMDGEELLGCANYASNSLSINLHRIMDGALRDVEALQYFSLYACWHNNLWLTILHEIHHLTLGNPSKDDVERAKRDTEADEWADEVWKLMAKAVNIEPHNYLENKFFSENFQAAVNTIEDEQLRNLQTMMLSNHIMASFPGDKAPVNMHSFRMVQHFSSGDAMDAPEWTAPARSCLVHAQVLPVTVAAGVANQSLFPTGNEAHAEPIFMEPNASGAFMQTTVPTQPMQPITPSIPMTHQAPAPTLAQTGLTPEDTGRIVWDVIMKCYNHIFMNCGPLQGVGGAFGYPDAVANAPIPLTPQEQMVVYAMDAVDAQGRWCPNTPTNNGLRGKIMKDSKIPAYMLCINVCGVAQRRLLLPQNPTNQSKTAVEARNGSRIMYVIEGDEAIKAQLKATGGGSGFYFAIKDGSVEACGR